MKQLSRSEVRKNRQKWINKLKDPKTQKHKLELENFDDSEQRCCLGHGCNALGIEKFATKFFIYYEGCRSYAPEKFIYLIGLNDRKGSVKQGKINFESYSEVNLSNLNDDTEATPQEIGEYLEIVIEGGDNTPWRSLDDYPIKIKKDVD